MNGVLLINKPKNITSRDVVNDVASKLGIKKVGHTGTLDPIATGVLVVCIGKATKVVELLTSLEKEYVAEVMLGISTDTLDITGNIIDTKKVFISIEKISEILNSFKGKYQQQVPIYSAVKVSGKKLYEYAREGKDVVLPKREVEIKDIQLISDLYEKDGHLCFQFKTTVSKGTYIRSLIKDICDRLNVIGCMSELKRTKQGCFTIEQCIDIDDVSVDKLLDIKDILDILQIEVDDYLMKKISNGQILENRYDSNLIMYIYQGNILAIYQADKDDPNKVRPYKMFGGIK